MKNIKLSCIVLLMMFAINCRDDDGTFQEVMNEVVVTADFQFENQEDFAVFQEGGFTRVIGNITIVDNVTSLASLTTLRNVEGDILIQDTNLTTLNGLENLISITGDLSIVSNSNQGQPIQNINDFCALQNLFSNGNFTTVDISGNGFNPTVQDIIDGNCSI